MTFILAEFCELGTSRGQARRATSRRKAIAIAGMSTSDIERRLAS